MNRTQALLDRRPRRIRATGRYVCAALIAFGISLELSAQTRRESKATSRREPAAIIGFVIDSLDDALEGAEVVLLSTGQIMRVGSGGSFRFDSVEAGAQLFRFRKFGYAPVTHASVLRAGETSELVVRLEALPHSLRPVVVQARNGEMYAGLLRSFHERKARGFGQFVTREQIEATRPLKLTDVLRRVPGVRVQNGNALLARGRISLASSCRRMLYFVDGLIYVPGSSLDEIPWQMVEAAEVYSAATVPPEFNHMDAACGVLVIWMRDAQEEARRRGEGPD